MAPSASSDSSKQQLTPSVSSAKPKKVGTQYLIESIRRNIVTPSVSSTRGRSIPEHFQSYGMPTISDSARLVNRVFKSHIFSIQLQFFTFSIQSVFHLSINNYFTTSHIFTTQYISIQFNTIHNSIQIHFPLSINKQFKYYFISTIQFNSH